MCRDSGKYLLMFPKLTPENNIRLFNHTQFASVGYIVIAKIIFTIHLLSTQNQTQ